MASFTPPNPNFQGMTAEVPTSNVELSVSCKNLRDLDVFSKSDPMCVLFMEQFGGTGWTEIGRTEVILNNLNPEFVKKFVLTYYFEERQKLRFEIYDVDSTSPVLANHDFLGRFECSLGEIVSLGAVSKPLLGTGGNYGTIIVSCEELSSCRDEVTFQFSGKKLDKKSYFLFWGSSSPFLSFSRANENNTFTVVHRTEHLLNTVNPSWRPFTIPVTKLCNGDYDRVVKVTCHDYQSNGSHKFIGEFATDMRQLCKESRERNTYELINSAKQKKGSYNHSGEIVLMSSEVRQIHTFVDYIRGGTEICCTIAVDFTASNGDPRNPQSLHYMDPYVPNQYVQALRAVGEIIQDYDSDKMFPVLGFGARVPPTGQVSHEFFVNMNATSPFCAGIDGCIAAYQHCLTQVQLYGPTNFSPVISHVAQFARATQDGSKYHILLILTDGIITDMAKTKDAIVQSSSLPLSIIIVGVGDADFGAMEELDGDVVRLSSKGRYAERDIVQFVPFRDYINGLKGPATYVMTQAKLAKAVLAEVPSQFLSFMKQRGVKPGTPKLPASAPLSDPQRV